MKISFFNTNTLRIGLFCLFAGCISPCQSLPSTVYVGGYLFPPFVQIDDNNAISGLTLDLIDLFNRSQSDFEFHFILTSPNRRYRDFERGIFDALFFENKQWSWQGHDIVESQTFLSGGEVFITQAKKNRKQSYFEDLSQKEIVAILGYHYNFANSITNPTELRKRFNIRLVNSARTIINQIKTGKSDIGITTYSYLQTQFKHNPDLHSKILVSEKFDQVYKHKILLRKQHSLTIKAVNEILDKVSKDGSLNELLGRYGLKPLK